MTTNSNNKIQSLFLVVNIILVIFMVLFYGNRALNIKENDNDSLKMKIVSNSLVNNKEGLYQFNDEYIFRGQEVDNYLSYRGLLWRIVKIDNNDQVVLIANNRVNMLPFNSEVSSFEKSDIFRYLNDEFKTLLNIESSSVISNREPINDINNIDIHQQFTAQIGLLDVVSYLNTIYDEKTFVCDKDEKIWLSDYKNDGVYYAINNKLSSCEPSELHSIKPVITIDGNLVCLAGTGSLENPYYVEEDKGVEINDIIILGQDKWIVTKVMDKIYLVSDLPIAKMPFGQKKMTFELDNKDNLAKYLNEEYYNSLDYKDLLVKTKWNNGNYNGQIEDVSSKQIESYIGIPALTDLQLSKAKDYWLANSKNDYMFVYGQQTEEYKQTQEFNVVVTIALNKDVKLVKQENHIWKVGE